MEIKAYNALSESTIGPVAGTTRRKKREPQNDDVRFFLPKAGSSPSQPELGQEMKNESHALIEALKSGQPFYIVTAWKAVAEANGGVSPIILKEAMARK